MNFADKAADAATWAFIYSKRANHHAELAHQLYNRLIEEDDHDDGLNMEIVREELKLVAERSRKAAQLAERNADNATLARCEAERALSMPPFQKGIPSMPMRQQQATRASVFSHLATSYCADAMDSADRTLQIVQSSLKKGG